jgi:hypothetical protein
MPVSFQARIRQIDRLISGCQAGWGKNLVP